MRYLVVFIFCCSIGLVVYMWWQRQDEYKYVEPLHWMEEQVSEDLQHYKQNGVTPKMIEMAKEAIASGKLTNVILITISDQNIETFPKKKSKRVEMVVKRIAKIKKQGGNIPNTSFLLGDHDSWNLMDRVPENVSSELPPIFVFAASRKDRYRHQYVLIPDDHTLGDHLIGYRRGWYAISREILSARNSFPWDKKKDIAFWRGLDTDNSGYKENESPRTRLVALAKEYPNYIDAQFTHTVVANDFVVRNLRPLMLMFSIPPYVSQADQLQYKILLNLDGHTATYPGYLWRLLSGCVALKQETSNEQWFYRITKPWIHYVPMEEGLEDAMEKIKWILSHDQEAKKMADMAEKLVINNLMMEHIDAYIILLLNRYHDLMRNQ